MFNQNQVSKRKMKKGRFRKDSDTSLKKDFERA